MEIDLNLLATITLAILVAAIIKRIYFYVLSEILSKLLSQPTVADPKHSGSAHG